MRQLGSLIAVNLVITFAVPGISWQGHLGGLVVGAAIGAAMVFPSKESRTRVQIGVCVAVLAVLGALTVYKAENLEPWTCKHIPELSDTYCGPPQSFE